MAQITVGKTCIAIEDGTYLDALKLAGAEAGALAVYRGGTVCPLDTPAAQDCAITPITLRDAEGQRIYERSLLMVLLAAVAREYPGVQVQVEHSLPQGLYMLLKGLRFLSNSVIAKIESAMRELIQQDLPIEREIVSKQRAVTVFEQENQPDKVRLLKYRPFDHFRMYRLCGQENYFYGEMAPSTGYLKNFALRLHLPGIVLVKPDAQQPEQLTKAQLSPKLADVFAQSERWGEILGAQVVADLNEMVDSGRIREFIRINEALHEKTISHIADEIYDRQPRVVLVAGPSSSGKTTFTNRLYVQMRVSGLEPILISLDNYYRDRQFCPRDENGEPDFESLYALDVDYFNEQLVGLLQGNEVELPVFDFTTGKRAPKGIVTRLKENQPILIEGIHGLNDALTYDIPREYKYKIFISALTQLNMDSHNRIRSTDCRLLRRLTRDYATRASSMEQTIGMWASVRRGEEKWIFPFQEQADYIFNSALTYELCVIKKYIYPLLSAVSQESPCYHEAHRLMKFLNYIVDAPRCIEDEIPPTSILREFIGGNTFYAK
jgi:uridine kinase